MTKQGSNRLLVERPLPQDEAAREAGTGGGRRRRGRGPAPARSVTVNLAESPLGWLKARGLVSARQFEAGEMLRADWERAQLAPSTTMRWDSPPPDRNPRCAPEADAPGTAQIAARRRFDSAVRAAGPGLGDILWRVVCAGEGMREVERALGWPARAGRIVLGFALDRLAEHYRLR